MDKDLEIVFRDMEAEGLIEKFRSVRPVKNVKHIKFLNTNVERVFIEKPTSRYILKKTNSPQGLASAASSKMYKQSNIQTPQVFLTRTNDKNIVRTIQEDISDINGFETVLAGEDVEFTKIAWNICGKYKWQIFYDANFEYKLLNIMTEDCLEQLKNMFLADELRTDIDRHSKNYFFYKNKDSEKYEGVIVIDLDQMVIFNYSGLGKTYFEEFLLSPYESEIPHLKLDNVCYKQRVRDMRELVQDGVLSNDNIEMLRKLLSYDFGAEMDRTCKEQGLRFKKKNMIVEPVKRLWEYNNETIGKDLGL